MASWLLPAVDFLSIPKGPSLIHFSSWIIISPFSENCIDFLLKDSQVRRSD